MGGHMGPHMINMHKNQQSFTNINIPINNKNHRKCIIVAGDDNHFIGNSKKRILNLQRS